MKRLEWRIGKAHTPAKATDSVQMLLLLDKRRVNIPSVAGFHSAPPNCSNKHVLALTQ